MHSTTTTAGFQRGCSLPRRRSSESALGLFLSATLLLAVSGCSDDVSLGTLRGGEPRLRAGGAPDTVYATDGRSLYSLDTSRLEFGVPMALAGCDLPVVEITQNEHRDMYGAGFEDGRAALYEIDPATGACHVVSRFATPAPWAVGFGLARTVTEQAALFGDEGGSLVLLDAAKGTRTAVLQVPRLGRSGCDIDVAGDGSAVLSELVDWRDPASVNVLEAVEPATGRVLRTYALAAGTVLEGLAHWGGTLYGFGRDGRVVAVSFEGAAARLTFVPTHGGPAHFTGAASIARPDNLPR